MGLFGSKNKNSSDDDDLCVWGGGKGKPIGKVKVGGKVKTPRGMTPNMKGMGGSKTAPSTWKRAGTDRSGNTVWKRTK